MTDRLSHISPLNSTLFHNAYVLANQNSSVVQTILGMAIYRTHHTRLERKLSTQLGKKITEPQIAVISPHLFSTHNADVTTNSRGQLFNYADYVALCRSIHREPRI